MRRTVFALAIAVAAASAATARPTNEPVIAPDALRADLDLAFSALKEGTPALYRFTSKARVDRAFAEARKQIDRPMTPLEFYRVMAPAVASIRNGHTFFSASADTYTALREQKLPPLGVRVIHGRAFILRDFSGASPSLAGAEILAVNGRSASDVIAQLSRSLSLDGAIPTSRDRNNSGWGFIYDLPLIADIHSPYALTVRADGLTRRVTIEGLTSRQLTERWKQFPLDREADPDRKAGLKLIDDVAVLTIPHWDYVEDGKRSMIDDIGDWFAAIRKQSPKALIIDIRSNSGGDEAVAAALFQRLAARPFREYRCIGVNATDFAFLRYVKDAAEQRKNLKDYTRPADPSCRWLAPLGLTNRPNIGIQQPASPGYSGKVIVLTDGGSFSTSAEFAALVRTNRRGIFVGEETSGAYYGNNSGIMIPLILPNSKLELSVPTVSYWLDVRRNVPKDRGIVPDIAVPVSIDDMIAGRDPVMAKAMALVRQKAAQSCRPSEGRCRALRRAQRVASYESARSPDPGALLGRDVERVAGLDAERRIPVVDVVDDAVDAELAIAVRVADRRLADRFRPRLAGPGLRPAEEDALVSRQPVEDRSRLAAERQVIGVQRHRQPAEVGEILAHGELGVDVNSGDRLELRILRSEHCRPALEFGGVGRRPPVA
jgi:hypothetical protein